MATSWTQTADDYRIETDDAEIIAYLETLPFPWEPHDGTWVIIEDPFRLQTESGTGARMPRETFELLQRRFGLR